MLETMNKEISKMIGTMRKLISINLLIGGIIYSTPLLAEQSQNNVVDQKAKIIMQDAQAKADKLVQDAKVKAQEIVHNAKEDVATFKKEAATSIKETNKETKTLANEALQKAKNNELVAKVKALPQVVKQDGEKEYTYAKEAINNSYQKSKDAIEDTRIHAAIRYALLMSKNIHSTKIKVEVKDGVVQLFGETKSIEEAEEAMRIALSTKGVEEVKLFFIVQD